MIASSTPGAGTSVVGRDWSWSIDAPPGWLVVPSPTTETAEVVGSWEHEANAMILRSFEPGTSGGQAEELVLSDEDKVMLGQLAAQSVARLREFADDVAPDGGRVVAALGVMDRTPVPVLVVVAGSEPGKPDDELVAAVGATGGSPVAPPNIEYLDLPDGDGIRVTRLDIDGATGAAWMNLAVGRRVERSDVVVDTVLLCRTQDILVVPAMVEALDMLLPTVRIDFGART